KTTSPHFFSLRGEKKPHFLLPGRMRRSHRRRRGLVASNEEEATSHLRRPAREDDDGSESSRESNARSPGSPLSSPSSSFSLD
ncbi:hypothetical protein BHM03_00058599, partial [Ensete ventricosum]